MPEGKLKIVGIPGGVPKFEEKTWISRRVNKKKWKISENRLERETNLKKSISSTLGTRII